MIKTINNFCHGYPRYILLGIIMHKGFPGGVIVKNSPVKTGDTLDTGLVPGLRSSSGKGMAIHSSILAWKIPWTEEHAGLQSMGSHRVGQE